MSLPHRPTLVPRDRTDPSKGFVEVDRNGLEVLDRAECLARLQSATLGRVGVTFGALPVILPVNFRLVDDQIVFRTNIGTKLDAATCETIVAFEVDDVDPVSHTGWSVVVTGYASEVSDIRSIAALDKEHIPRWAPRVGERYVNVSTEMMTGRQLNPDVWTQPG